VFLSAAPTGIHHSDEFANKVKLWDFNTSQGKDLYMNGWVTAFFAGKIIKQHIVSCKAFCNIFHMVFLT